MKKFIQLIKKNIIEKYKEEGFYEEHSYFTIYTEEIAYRYQIFAYRDVPETDSVYTIGFIPDDMYQNFLNEMVRKSYIDTGVSVSKEDKIITLSTCSTTGKRFIVQAVRVDEKAYQWKRKERESNEKTGRIKSSVDRDV